MWKSIFWLQQAPGASSAEKAYAHGREVYLSEIKSQLGPATRLYDELVPESCRFPFHVADFSSIRRTMADPP